MQGSLNQPPVIIRASRTRGLWLMIGSGAFVAIALMPLASGGSEGPLVFPLVFFGLCGLIGLCLLISPSRLEISPSGITQTVLWRTARFAWSDVHAFRPATIGLTNKTVGFDYLVERPSRGGLRRLNSAIAGVQGSLAAGWEIKPEPLADLLNQAREQWAVRVAGPLEVSSSTAVGSKPEAGVAGERINRKAYWITIGMIYAMAIALSFIPGTAHVAGYAVMPLQIRVFARRFHDIGQTGWWQVFMWMAQVVIVVVGAAGDWSLVAGLLIQLVFTGILGALPGNPGSNLFGPPPGKPWPTESPQTVG